MWCPSCRDEYEEHVRTCAACGVALVPGDLPPPRELPPIVDRHLGTFHPAVAAEVTDLVERRGVLYTVRRRDEGVEILVDGRWRDDLRTELAMTWTDLLGRLDPAATTGLASAGASAPGWHDAPRGGYVDRAGRLVVEPGEVEEQATDAARVVGPMLLTIGAIAGVIGWYLVESPALVVAGVLLALIGALTPR